MIGVLVQNGIVSNLIEIEQDKMAEFSAQEFYEGCAIGEPYNPPKAPPTDHEVLNALLGVTDNE